VIRSATNLIDQTYARNSKGLITAITSPDATRSWTYGYDALDRLITADNANSSSDDRTYAYHDADNMVFNSGLCAANPNMAYPAPGAIAIRLEACLNIKCLNILKRGAQRLRPLRRQHFEIGVILPDAFRMLQFQRVGFIGEHVDR